MFDANNRLAVFGVIGGIFAVWLVVAAAGWLLTGADRRPDSAAAPKPSGPLAFTDDAGRSVTLDGPAERIVAGASFAVELLMALDHAPVLRPDVPERKVHPAAARSIPTFRVEHGAGPDAEAIAAARGDLVILHVNFAPFAENVSRTLGVPVALFEISSLEDVSTKLELLGRITGRREQAAVQIAALRERIEAVVADQPQTPARVLALFGTPEAFYAYRATSYLGSMIEALGAQNIAGDKEAVSGMRSIAPLDLEQAIGRDPQVILIVPHGPPDAVTGYLASHPAWSQMPAVKSGRVHVLDEVLFSSNPGPRAPQALDELKRLLGPDSP